MDLFRTVYEINGENRIFFLTHVYLAPSRDGFPLDHATASGGKNWNDTATRCGKRQTMCSDLDTVLTLDRHTMTCDNYIPTHVAVRTLSLLMLTSLFTDKHYGSCNRR